MAEYNFEFSGWRAIAALVAVTAIFGARLVSFSDKTDDQVLMKNLEMQLMSEYYPTEVERMKAAVKAGDDETVQSVLDAKVSIDSVEASSPPLNFSTPKKVVVKVVYSLNDSVGTVKQETVYYLYNHGLLLGNTWSYQYKTNKMHYYMNFL